MPARFINHIYKCLIFLYDAFGLKYVWEKINPPLDDKGQQPARTIFLWLLGIYVSLFGLASSRYEQILSRLENHVNFIISQTESENWKSLATEIPRLQNVAIPVAPSIINPFSVISSFIHYFDKIDLQTVNELQAIIYRKKGHLANFNLSNLLLANDIDLINSDIIGKSFKVYAIKKRNFSKSNFEETILDKANLENINFYKSNFKGAILSNTNMKHCNLSDANLSDAILLNADLRRANLLHANFKNTVLEGANLEKSILIGANLTETHDLATAKLEGALYNSTKFEMKNIPKDEEIKLFCEIHKLDTSCAEFIIGHISSIFEIANKFPADFNPAKHGMVDIYEIIGKNKK